MANSETTATPGMIREARELDGLYAGLLAEDEYAALLAAGVLRLSYEPPGGIFGLAKLRFVDHG